MNDPRLFDLDQRPVEANARVVGRRHPDTAQKMERDTFPRSGTLRAMIYDRIKGYGGLTDDELEVLLVRSHQSVSGARSTLKRDGHVEDSGERRMNRYGNEAIVWRIVAPE